MTRRKTAARGGGKKKKKGKTPKAKKGHKLHRIKKFLKLWKQIKSRRGAQFAKLISRLPADKIHLLSECVYNALYTDLRLSQKARARVRARLIPHKKDFARIADKKEPIKSKRKLLLQHGSGIFTLLGSLVPVIVSAIVAATK